MLIRPAGVLGYQALRGREGGIFRRAQRRYLLDQHGLGEAQGVVAFDPSQHGQPFRGVVNERRALLLLRVCGLPRSVQERGGFLYGSVYG